MQILICMYMLKYFLLITYLQWSASAKDLFVDKYTILKQQKPFKKSHQVKKLTKTCHPPAHVIICGYGMLIERIF